ncbi:NAD/NADP octopine/nopaline dehydrogenase family protein [Rhizobium leguminosarum]|uniref:Vitopine synthase n=1 Tax=Rhizobium leguminosarum TaxID=384 RepID=A0A7K3VTF1_RHILE|nr:NAD/NADP-dependent octopine/nopaline dehydrogenase family protein [Rhizobium leguminosarum]NEK20470.1 vitopine synthase [Rhizobium leguminosarum]
MTKVAILGAGNLAITLAGDIALRLHGELEAMIWVPETNRRNFAEVQQLGTLQLIGSQYDGPFVPKFEDKLEAVVEGATLIVLAVPTMGQKGILESLQPFDLSEAVLVALPGSATSLVAKQILVQGKSPYAIVESTTSPYACRRKGSDVFMLGLKKTFEVAANAPLQDCNQYLAALFPNPVQWYHCPASIFLSNTNPVAHPPGILTARAAIESGVRPLPKFYSEFVANAIEEVLAIDNERLAIVAALKLESETDFGYCKKWYGGEALDSKQFYRTYEGYAAVETPPTMNHRYLTEDVKHIMVLWVEIAKLCRVAVPRMEGVIKAASDVLGENLLVTGRTLHSIGLANATLSTVVDALRGL